MPGNRLPKALGPIHFAFEVGDKLFDLAIIEDNTIGLVAN